MNVFYWLLTFILENLGGIPPTVVFFSAALAIIPIAWLAIRTTPSTERIKGMGEMK